MLLGRGWILAIHSKTLVLLYHPPLPTPIPHTHNTLTMTFLFYTYAVGAQCHLSQIVHASSMLSLLQMGLMFGM